MFLRYCFLDQWNAYHRLSIESLSVTQYLLSCILISLVLIRKSVEKMESIIHLFYRNGIFLRGKFYHQHMQSKESNEQRLSTLQFQVLILWEEIRSLNDCNGARTYNRLVCKWTLNRLAKLASLAKRLSARLRTEWLWVRTPLQSLKLQVLHLFRARSSWIFRQL